MFCNESNYYPIFPAGDWFDCLDVLINSSTTFDISNYSPPVSSDNRQATWDGQPSDGPWFVLTRKPFATGAIGIFVVIAFVWTHPYSGKVTLIVVKDMIATGLIRFSHSVIRVIHPINVLLFLFPHLVSNIFDPCCRSQGGKKVLMTPDAIELGSGGNFSGPPCHAGNTNPPLHKWSFFLPGRRSALCEPEMRSGAGHWTARAAWIDSARLAHEQGPIGVI